MRCLAPLCGLALAAALVSGCGQIDTTTAVRADPTTSDSFTPLAPTPTPDSIPPKPEDFSLRVKTLKKECFGSAGCNVTYSIRVTLLNEIESEDTEYEVTYKVTGGEDPVINTFTIQGTEVSYEEEEFVGTSSSSSKLKAEVIEVEES
ncbi:hypothetical protein [Nonomuraea endophytica]|uniref:Uncharacterized protein n=1 Tax=Nonomuraea endophytica TaxID=714136 RepID=A0A7W7ZYJ1_9ACTN|nr:hypothetical protein [Nonomuraea endophytica]MBB5075814.1 hypothetical protein [Nonomuraea endophytica]